MGGTSRFSRVWGAPDGGAFRTPGLALPAQRVTPGSAAMTAAPSPLLALLCEPPGCVAVVMCADRYENAGRDHEFRASGMNAARPSRSAFSSQEDLSLAQASGVRRRKEASPTLLGLFAETCPKDSAGADVVGEANSILA